MRGRRVADDTSPSTYQPGDYGRLDLATGGQGEWFARSPTGNLTALLRHQVVQHDDGTISVLAARVLARAWQGTLERGMWQP